MIWSELRFERYYLLTLTSTVRAGSGFVVHVARGPVVVPANVYDDQRVRR